MNKLTIAKRHLAVVLACGSNPTGRYVLENVQAGRRDNQAWLAATDGRCLMIAEWDDDGDDFAALIPSSLIMTAHLQTGPKIVTLVIEKNHVTIDADNITLSADVATGKFPDWRKVEIESEKLKVVLDVAHVRDAAEFCNSFDGKICLEIPASAINAKHGTPEPVVIRDNCGNKVFIMPLKAGT